MSGVTYMYFGTGYAVTWQVSQAVLVENTKTTFQPSNFSPSFFGATLFVGSKIAKVIDDRDIDRSESYPCFCAFHFFGWYTLVGGCTYVNLGTGYPVT